MVGDSIERFLWSEARLGLSVPHVFRHTGPSNDAYHRRRTEDEIRRQGRWASLKSVARYMKPGRLLLQWRKVDPSLRGLAEQHAAVVGGQLVAVLASLPMGYLGR